MSSTALGSKSFKPRPWFGRGGALGELVAAMPIVIFVNALRDALNHPARGRTAGKPD